MKKRLPSCLPIHRFRRRRVFGAGLLLVLTLVPASAERRKLVQVSGSSPFDRCSADQPDRQLGMVFPDSEVEPWVAVNPRNRYHMVAAWQQDRWSNGGARGLVAAVTFDGGRHWREVTLPGLSACTGGDFSRASDPWLTFAANGDVYHIALLAADSLIEFLAGERDTGRSAMAVQKSVDGGLTWSEPIVLVDEEFAGLHDKQSITADPHDARFVYAVWDREDFDAGSPALFSRTTDGGNTWETPRVLHDPGLGRRTLGNQIVVLPNGVLINFFTEYEETEEASLDQFWLAFKYSPDHGETWLPEGASIIISTLEPALERVDPETGQAIRAAEFLFDVAVDAISGTLYAVWQDGRFNDAQYDSIALSVSHDSGMTWTPPVKINQTPTHLPIENQQALVPSVAVNDLGDVAITYYDFRFDGDEPRALTDYWAITCRLRKAFDCSIPLPGAPSSV